MAGNDDPVKPDDNDTVYSYSYRDLTIIPNDFDMEFVSKFVKSKSYASGQSHENKGFKYFHDEFLHISGK